MPSSLGSRPNSIPALDEPAAVESGHERPRGARAKRRFLTLCVATITLAAFSVLAVDTPRAQAATAIRCSTTLTPPTQTITCVGQILIITPLGRQFINFTLVITAYDSPPQGPSFGDVLTSCAVDIGSGMQPLYTGPCPRAVAKEYWMWNGGMYSYEDTCADGTHIDPITTVIRYRGSSAAATLDGLGMTYTSDTQQFRDVGRCVAGDFGQADDAATKWCLLFRCANERWHARGHINSTPDPNTGTWASLTPHWDSSDGSSLDLCVHWVPAVFDGPGGFGGSGFDAGKDYLYTRLVTENNYHFEGAQYWDNLLQRRQCNGAHDMTGSNGWVNIIDG